MLAVNTFSIICVSISSQINIPLKNQRVERTGRMHYYLCSFTASFYLGPQADSLSVAIISFGLTQCTLG